MIQPSNNLFKMEILRKFVKTTITEPTRENPETPRKYVETQYIKGYRFKYLRK